jgi:hypothetical protein
MKNIHVLPTDKASDLWLMHNKSQGLMLLKTASLLDGIPQNIYITSDEYIGLSYYLDGNLVRKGVIDDKEYWKVRKDYKKIILTTDEDLIKDGVQVIDDEFLEWFVQNPSCEEVETHIVELCTNCSKQYCNNLRCIDYEDKVRYLISYSENTTKQIITYCDGYEVGYEKIIIPSEKPKQETSLIKALKDISKHLDKMNAKYETIEDAAEKLYPVNKNGGSAEMLNKFQLDNSLRQEGFFEGVKFQSEISISKETYENSLSMQRVSNAGYESKITELKQEITRMYSEEDIQEYAQFCVKNYHITIKEWFEISKKK